ncbi:MAG TPA: hypothetical protein VFA18_17950, partial [Gemmataceae bacterium]|nr:hypothetical protein [Gemmataceae bacterium]
RRRDNEDEAPAAKAPGRLRKRDEEDLPRSRPVPAKRLREEEEDFEDRPHPKKSARSIKKQGGHRGLLIGVAGGVLLLALLSGGGWVAYSYWFSGINRGSGEEDPLAYVPADSNFVAGLDLTALYNDPTLGPQIQEKFLGKNGSLDDNFLERVKTETGLRTQELFAQMTVAGKYDTSRANLAGAGNKQDKPSNLTLVLRPSKPFDQKKVAKALKDPVQKRHQGMLYYEFKENDETSTVFMPSNRTLVLTLLHGNQVEGIVGSNGQPALPVEAVTLIRGVAKNTGWVALLPGDEDRKTLVASLEKQPIPAEGKIFTDALAKARGAAFYGHLDTQANLLKFGGSLLFGDNAAAADLTKQLNSQWDKQKGQLPFLLLLLPPSVKKVAEEVTNSLKFSAEGSLSMVSAQVNRTTATEFFNEMQKGGPGLVGGAPPAGGRGIQPPARGPIQPPGGIPGGRGGRGKGK